MIYIIWALAVGLIVGLTLDSLRSEHDTKDDSLDDPYDPFQH